MQRGSSFECGRLKYIKTLVFDNVRVLHFNALCFRTPRIIEQGKKTYTRKAIAMAEELKKQKQVGARCN